MEKVKSINLKIQILKKKKKTVKRINTCDKISEYVHTPLI